MGSALPRCTSLLVAVLALACDSYKSPTAPPLAPAPPPVAQTPPPAPAYSWVGSMKVESASPVGDCFADALNRNRPEAWSLAFTFPHSEGSWDGTYLIPLLGSCPFSFADRGKNGLHLTLYPYCDFSYPKLEATGCTLSGAINPFEMILPPTALTDPTTTSIRGPGTVTVRQWGESSLPDVVIRVTFDLHKQG